MAYLHDPGPDGNNSDTWNTDPQEDRGSEDVRGHGVISPWGKR
ncbi:hypothetical protein OG874_00680 [Nocardia sp. NBC_00565]|nr:hypothetical protein [Nocardia sp. NBC_00565]WUC03771.1 hypothetical protein OG874_00680 [Nocardia sp. NBC_00565]